MLKIFWNPKALHDTCDFNLQDACYVSGVLFTVRTQLTASHTKYTGLWFVSEFCIRTSTELDIDAEPLDTASE